jgi:hypothetical protein
MSWFEQHGFSRQNDVTAYGDPWQEGGVNTTPPVGNATPLPGATADQARATATNPGNARTSAAGQEPFNEAEFRALIQSYPPTNEGVRAAYAAAQARWGNQVPELLEHPHRLDKFRFADGRVVDFIGAAGGPNPSHVWNLEGPGHGGGSVGALGGMMGGNWQAGMDPSYEWRFKEGQKALERSAASKGTLLTGGTLKALAAYGQGLASTEFGNIFNRNYQIAGLGLNAAQAGAQTGTSYGNQVGNTAANQAQTGVDLTTGAGNAQAAGSIASGNAWGNTIGNLANIAGQYYAGKRGRDPVWGQPGHNPTVPMDGTV